MEITRRERPTGGPSRTRRETIVPLNTGPREVEPEGYLDCSESEGWSWDSRPGTTTWAIQEETARLFLEPFEELDSQAREEQSGGDDEKGGVYFYPFSNVFQPIGTGEDDGDLNLTNFQRKMTAFKAKYFSPDGKPKGGTQIMEAVKAADRHFLKEFGKDPRADRPVRARVVFTDGALNDAAEFTTYLQQATHSDDGYGSHGDWDEVWAIAIFGEEGGGGHAAYEQYVELSKAHPWIHAYYFSNVTNAAEIAEDMAVAVVPVQA